MFTEIITITPEMAKEWLASNIKNNRPIKRAKEYAEDMKAGKWRLTHQGIAFNEEGTLIDGQNRLTAIVMANIPVTMSVAFDCPADSFEVLDIGRPRSLGDYLKTQNYKNYNTLGGLVKRIQAYEKGYNSLLSVNGAGHGLSAETRLNQIEFFEANKEKLIECNLYGNMVYQKSTARLMSPGDIGLLYWVFDMTPEANEFIIRISTGINLQPDTSAFCMRKILEEVKNQIKYHTSSELVGYWKLAWAKRNVPTKILQLKKV